jgi:hypothetical protein
MPDTKTDWPTDCRPSINFNFIQYIRVYKAWNPIRKRVIINMNVICENFIFTRGVIVRNSNKFTFLLQRKSISPALPRGKNSSFRSRINNIQQQYGKSRGIKSGHVSTPVQGVAGTERRWCRSTICQLCVADYFRAADKFRTGPSQLYDPGRVSIKFKSPAVFDLIAPDGATRQCSHTY